jgi:hypothetical protein
MAEQRLTDRQLERLFVHDRDPVVRRIAAELRDCRQQWKQANAGHYLRALEERDQALAQVKDYEQARLLRVRELDDLRTQVKVLTEALELLADGTDPERIGRYDFLRDWVHKTANDALAKYEKRDSAK